MSNDNPKLRRWDPVEFYDMGGSGYGQMKEAADGDYVRFEDVEPIMRDRDAARALAAQTDPRLIEHVAVLREALTAARDELNALFAKTPVTGPLPSPSVMQQIAHALEVTR